MKKTKFLTTCGLLIALTVVFQSLSKFLPLGPYGNFITGTLVNACLLLSTTLIGFWGGAAVGVVTPFMALLTGSAIPLPFTPVIVGGNFLLVLVSHLLRGRGVLKIASAAVVKTTFLFVCVVTLLPHLRLSAGQAAMMLYLFGWPQLVTALAGGVIAAIASRRLKKTALV